MTAHTIRVVPNATDASTKAIFELHSTGDNLDGIQNEDVLHLTHLDGTSRVVNKDGIEIGSFPTGHPLNHADMIPSLRIETYKVVGQLEDPTLPRLHLTITQEEKQ